MLEGLICYQLLLLVPLHRLHHTAPNLCKEGERRMFLWMPRISSRPFCWNRFLKFSSVRLFACRNSMRRESRPALRRSERTVVMSRRFLAVSRTCGGGGEY
ncbi:hypothetical protein E2C01_023260 [Portunus trituberculatus]|uniref:Uncharacterized protein n=1 Tax=Portunus trituberculatus TaxID=210409 RepID=A0A5B7E9X5_PORTR|nr:hypothetical protein [Portunus trituberculatus]